MLCWRRQERCQGRSPSSSPPPPPSLLLHQRRRNQELAEVVGVVLPPSPPSSSLPLPSQSLAADCRSFFASLCLPLLSFSFCFNRSQEIERPCQALREQR